MFSISEDPEQLVLPIKTLISDLIKYLIIYKAKILYGGNLTYDKPEYNLLTQMLETLDFYKSEGKIRFDELENLKFNYKDRFDKKKLDKYLQLAGITRILDAAQRSIKAQGGRITL